MDDDHNRQQRPIVVNSLLCFIHNYRERLQSNQLNSLIHSYFTKNVIENAHSMLIDLLPRLESTVMPTSTPSAPPLIPSTIPTASSCTLDKAAASSTNLALGTTMSDANTVVSTATTGTHTTATTPKCQLKAAGGAAQAGQTSSSNMSSALPSPSSSPKKLLASVSSESISVTTSTASEIAPLSVDNDEDANSKLTTSASNDDNEDGTNTNIGIDNTENIDNNIDNKSEESILCLYDRILNSRKASLPIFVAEELNTLPLALIMADDHNGDARYELLLAEIRQLKCFIHDALRLNNNYSAHQRSFGSCSNCDMTLSPPTSLQDQTDVQRTPLSSSTCSCSYTFSSNSTTPISSHHKKIQKQSPPINSSCPQSLYYTYPHCMNDNCNIESNNNNHHHHHNQRQVNDNNMSSLACTSSPESPPSSKCTRFITASNSDHPTITTDPCATCEFSSPMPSDTSSCSTGSSNTTVSSSSCSLTAADISHRLLTAVTVASSVPVASTSEAAACVATVSSASSSTVAQLNSSSALSPPLCCCSSSSAYSSTSTSNSSTISDTSNHRNFCAAAAPSTTSSSFSSYCTPSSHNLYHQHHHRPLDHNYNHFNPAHRASAAPAGGLRDILLSNAPRASQPNDATDNEDNNLINGLITNKRTTTVDKHCNNKHHLHLSCTNNNNDNSANNNDNNGISSVVNGGDDSDHEHNSSSSSSGSSTANETVTDQQTDLNNTTTATNFLLSSSSLSNNSNNNDHTDSTNNDDSVKNHLRLQQKKRCFIGGVSGAVNGGSRLDATVRKLRRLADKHQTQIASAPIKATTTTYDDKLSLISPQNYAVTNNTSDNNNNDNNNNRSSPATLSAPPSVTAAAASSPAAATATKLPSSSSSSSSLAKTNSNIYRTANNSSPTSINNNSNNTRNGNSQASTTSNTAISSVWPAQIVDPIAYINMLRTMTMSAMSSVVVSQQHNSNNNNNHHPQTSIFPQSQAQAAQAAAITSAAAAAKSILLATDHHHNSSVLCAKNESAVELDEKADELTNEVEKNSDESSPSPSDSSNNIDEFTYSASDLTEKPFTCEHANCHKRFANKFLLKKHQFIHTGLRPHCCPFCGKRFNRKDNLLRHKKTHLANALGTDVTNALSSEDLLMQLNGGIAEKPILKMETEQDDEEEL